MESDADNYSRATQTCFVYSRQTGEVVHIHQFVPAGPDGRATTEEMEEAALRLAPAAYDRADLATLQGGAALDLTPAMLYRVDVERGELIEEPVRAASAADPEAQER